MRKIFFAIPLLMIGLLQHAQSQTTLSDTLPVRGFAIAAPSPAKLDSFVVFINTELAPRHINTLVLRVDYNYQYKSHPELVAENALSYEDVQKMVKACRDHQINLIPQINLLGHQSWANKNSKLLEVYPQFDETPWVKMPAVYKWPNADSLYCKSYCPLHPGVHKVVFDVVDEICDAFHSNAFHAGMDEVFYIGMDKCPRCHGKDCSVLFADEMKRIRDHLAQKNRALWLWGDRFLDGRTTGIGEWEASYNDTYRAVDLIPKDIVICDWHYERADKTPVYFAAKGLKVITCPWRKPDVAAEQLEDMYRFRAQSTPEMKERFYGMMQTVWSGVDGFLHEFYYGTLDPENKGMSVANTFRKTFPVIKDNVVN